MGDLSAIYSDGWGFMDISCGFLKFNKHVEPISFLPYAGSSHREENPDAHRFGAIQVACWRFKLNGGDFSRIPRLVLHPDL